MHEDTITNLLNIPNHKVTRIVENTHNRFVLILEPIEEVSPVCSCCDQTLSTSIHSHDAVVVEDLPISGKRVFLCVSKRKALCPTSNRIRVEKLTWIKKRFTQRFTEHVYRLTSITTNTEAGWFLGLDDETVYRIDRATLEEMAAQKLYPVTVPSHMSVDEVAWQKWHHYVTNVVAIEIRKVIWNHDGRGKTVLDNFYHALGPEGCKAIEAVVSDGARGFISSTKEHACYALLILDHFHVKKYLNDAIDQVRKKELKKARDDNNTALSAILHCNKRFILMQNKVTTKKQNILEKLSTLNEPVYHAMLLKEQFLSIYTSPDRKTAFINLRAWIVAALQSQIPSFIELGLKFFRKRHYILNYFICKITSAISEGINNKIKRLKRMAYGYKDVQYFLLKIHQHCGLLNPRLST